MTLDVVFRLDASSSIGTGHMVRCVALADAIRALGARVRFVLGREPGSPIDRLLRDGHAVHEIPSLDAQGASADASATAALLGAAPAVVVVDHYRLDAAWHRVMRTWARGIVVIDDLADRELDCDLLVDQNYDNPAHARYAHLTPRSARRLIGPRFALLRDQFARARDGLRRAADAQVRSVLVSMGGSDPGGHTQGIVEALARAPSRLDRIDVVVGSANPRTAQLEAATRDLPAVRVQREVSDMARLMATSDLAVTAGGGTTWERFCLGLPSVTVAIADNQLASCEALAAAGLHEYVGDARALGDALPVAVVDAVERLAADPARRVELARRGMELVDGRGCERVAGAILEQFGGGGALRSDGP